MGMPRPPTRRQNKLFLDFTKPGDGDKANANDSAHAANHDNPKAMSF
jgi:hypothetical protein